MDLREVFTPAAIAANWTEVASNQIIWALPCFLPARRLALICPGSKVPVACLCL